MKGANRYEKFEAVVVDRSEIQEAYYNPRRISEESLKKLKRFLKSKEGGLLAPLTWNQQTKNIVSGHQRLQILDTLHKGKPYKLTVAKVSMKEEDEVKANVFMNNPGAQGEWDVEKLQEIHDLFPDLDFTKDLAFDEDELDILGLDFGVDDFGDDDEPGEADSAAPSDASVFREAKKAGREQANRENANGDGSAYSKADFTLTFIFPSSESKREALERMGFKDNPARLNSQTLTDLLPG